MKVIMKKVTKTQNKMMSSILKDLREYMQKNKMMTIGLLQVRKRKRLIMNKIKEDTRKSRAKEAEAELHINMTNQETREGIKSSHMEKISHPMINTIRTNIMIKKIMMIKEINIKKKKNIIITIRKSMTILIINIKKKRTPSSRLKRS